MRLVSPNKTSKIYDLSQQTLGKQDERRPFCYFAISDLLCNRHFGYNQNGLRFNIYVQWLISSSILALHGANYITYANNLNRLHRTAITLPKHQLAVGCLLLQGATFFFTSLLLAKAMGNIFVEFFFPWICRRLAVSVILF